MPKPKNNVSSIAVAIVEDDVPAREILAGWIRNAEGFKCAGEFDDAETALAKLPTEKPSVVLFDINLPGMNGIECVRRLKPRLPETQFLMVTVYEDANHIFNALSAGASGYLLKTDAAQRTARRLEGCPRRRLAHEQPDRAQGGAILPPQRDRE